MYTDFIIDCRYVRDHESLCRIDSDTYGPRTRFIAHLMFALGVYRLFTREHFLNLMYRLAFIHQKMGMLKRYFTDGTLFVITVNGNNIPVKLDDFMDHLGMIVANPINNIPTNKWFWNFAESWNNQYFNGLIQHYTPEEDYFIYKIPERITPKMARPAIMFQKEIDSEVKREFYNDWAKRNDRALQNYHTEVKRRNFKWDISKIPIDVVHQCHAHIDKYFPVCIVTYDLAEELMKIAWYYANNYVYKHKFGFEETYPEFPYSEEILERYINDDQLADLKIVREDFELEKIERLLKFDWRESYRKAKKKR